MRLTAGQLNRATLARQLLLERADVPVAEAVRRVVTIQAQDPASPYLSLWARVAGLDAAAVDAAYDDRSIVRAQLMRVTLQTVAAADHAAFHGAMVPSLRGSRLNDPRFTGTTGMTAADADALLPELLAFVAEPRTGAAIEAWLEARVGRPVPRAWWAFRTFAPLVHTRGGGPWFHGPKVSVEAAPAGTAVVGDPAAAAQVLVRRYLEGFGPASARDVAQFSILRQPVVRAALDGLAGELVTYEGPDGRVLHDVPGGAIPDAGTPAPPRLLPMWETSLLAYAARERLVPEAHRTLVIRRNGDVLPAILVDGRVGGLWRLVDGAVEVTAFDRLPRRTWADLAAEAASLLAFLGDRDPAVYRRHWHWWGDLTGAEVRALGR